MSERGIVVSRVADEEGGIPHVRVVPHIDPVTGQPMARKFWIERRVKGDSSFVAMFVTRAELADLHAQLRELFNVEAKP